MPPPEPYQLLPVLLSALAPLLPAAEDLPTTEGRPDHQTAAEHHAGTPVHPLPDPNLPAGASLAETLARSGRQPPDAWPHPIMTDDWYAMLRFEQLEYRTGTGIEDHIGWDLKSWIGYDYDKLWFESEGEWLLDGSDSGAVENELLYARLITPFWNLQAGVGNELEWSEHGTEDTWLAVLALSGTAPYMIEAEPALVLTEDGDLSLAIEAAYALRITQRLVAQPRLEATIQAQDVPERDLGAGLSEVVLDLRLWYEIRREFAPYIGLRYSSLTGGTHNRAEDAGEDTDSLQGLAGLRLSF